MMAMMKMSCLSEWLMIICSATSDSAALKHTNTEYWRLGTVHSV